MVAGLLPSAQYTRAWKPSTSYSEAVTLITETIQHRLLSFVCTNSFIHPDPFVSCLFDISSGSKRMMLGIVDCDSSLL